MTGSPLLFANAMWRSGSTYLASRFAASDRYLLFYEPCHEGVGRRPSARRTRDRARDRGLRHPEIEGGYFGSFDRVDPESGHSLTALYAPEASLRSVYGEGSDGFVTYLAALGRAAAAEGRTALLGFCRSGTQHARAERLLAAPSLHLWRDPRDQFGSYGWPANDYFLAGTLLQLSFAPRFRGLARALAPAAFASPRLAAARLLADTQARLRYRLARPVAAALRPDQAYALFYLSWLVSFESARVTAEHSFSLAQVAHDTDLRERVEARYGIRFDELGTPRSAPRGDIGYAAIEGMVEARLSALSGTPASAPAYPPPAATAA